MTHVARTRLLAAVAFGLMAGAAASASAAPPTPAAEGEDGVFRPEPGTIPPVEKAHEYRGELVFVDHANRRGSIRVQGSGMFFRNDPHPFALLPCGVVRQHDAPADLRDIPLGTVLHVKAFLPPEPKLSVVPVLPVGSKNVDANHNRGTGIFPAENHVLLLEDEPSHCRREGRIWKLDELEISNNSGSLVARREPVKGAGSPAPAETLTFDAGTRVWRGRERLAIEELVAEGTWPAEGKKPLGGQPVYLGISWKPTPDGIFTRFHVSDIWLDDAALDRAARSQAEVHKAFIRSRWMPARVDTVEYGTFGRATVTVTLFGGMDPALYADFQEGVAGRINAVESTLRHTHGGYGPGHMSSNGTIVDVVTASGAPPLGSSGIQVRLETDLVIEGIRPGRTVRIQPGAWQVVNLPREEYIQGMEDRFPSPAIFPKY